MTYKIRQGFYRTQRTEKISLLNIYTFDPRYFDTIYNDHIIPQEELLAVLTMMVGANISPEQLLSIAERTILEADEDKDDLISFEEFAKVLERTDVEQKMSIRFLN